MIHRINFNLNEVKIIILLLVLIFSSNFSYAQKTIKVSLDDGTTRHYSVPKVTELTFEDDACDGVRTLTYEGKLYSTVQIGDQCWMQQNLDVGTWITAGSQTNNSVLESYCYDNMFNLCRVVGGLYQWNEAMRYGTNGTQGICPNDWHIPTLGELQTLNTTIGGSANKLKTIGQGNGTNTSGFSALMSGHRNNDGSFNNIGLATVFWSSSPNADLMIVWSDDLIEIKNFYQSSLGGYSVRCIKD